MTDTGNLAENSRHKAFTGFDFFGIFLLIAGSIKLYLGSWNAIDLPLYDDASYLFAASNFVTNLNLPYRNWSPLFAIYAGIFHVLFGGLGVTAVYVALRISVSMFNSVLTYIWLRRFLRPLTSFILSSFLLLSLDLLVLQSMHVIHPFVLAPILLVQILLTSSLRGRRGAALAILLLLILIRPEYETIFVIIFIGFLIFEILEWQKGSKLLSVLKGYIPLVLVIPVFALIYFASPANPDDRFWFAFQQHYTWSRFEQDDAFELSYHSVKVNVWGAVTSDAFGDADTLAEAISNNPGAFTNHIMYNLSILPAAIIDLIEPAYYTPLLWVFAALLIIGIVGFIIRLGDDPLNIWQVIRIYRDLSLFILLLLGLTFGVSLILMPVSKSVLPIFPLLLLMMGWEVEQIIVRLLPGKLKNNRIVAVFAVIVVLFIPLPFTRNISTKTMEQTTVAIQEAASVIDGQYSFLSPDLDSVQFCSYQNIAAANNNCSPLSIHYWDGQQSFETFLREFRVMFIAIPQSAIPLPEQTREDFIFFSQLIEDANSVGWQEIVNNDLFRIYIIESAYAALTDNTGNQSISNENPDDIPLQQVQLDAYRNWYEGASSTGELPDPDTLSTTDLTWLSDNSQAIVAADIAYSNGLNIARLLIHPPWDGQPPEQISELYLTIPESLSGTRLVLMAGMPDDGSAENSDGVAIVIEFPDIQDFERMSTIIEPGTGDSWHLILVNIPQITGQQRLNVSIEARETAFSDSTFIALIGMIE